MIYKNCYLSVNAVDLSAYVSSCDPSFDVEIQDDTAMGDSSRSGAPGLTNWTMSVQFKNPFAASGPDATIFSLVGAAAFAVVWKPVNAATSTTNPQYTMQALVSKWAPVGGDVGSEGVASLELVNGTGAVPARATS